MAGEEHEQPGAWEPTGWPGGNHRLVMTDPYVRLMTDRRASWNVTVGWPGVCALMRSGRAEDEAGAMRAAEAAAADLLRELAARVAGALEALGQAPSPVGDQ